MSLTQLQKLQINKMVDNILSSPSNKIHKGNILELSFVFDESSDKAYLKETASEVAASLKAHDKIFQNVRCNVIHWNKGNITSEIKPMILAQPVMQPVSQPAGEPIFQSQSNKPMLDELAAYLKLYQARSRCVIIFTSGEYELGDKEKLKEGLNPFLKTRLLIISPEGIVNGAKLNMEVM